MIIANPFMHLPQYSITRLKEDNVGKSKKQSYTLIQQPELLVSNNQLDSTSSNEPAVKTFTNHQPHRNAQNNFIKRVWKSLFGKLPESSSSSPSSNDLSKKPQSRQTLPGSIPKNFSDRRPQNNRRRPPRWKSKSRYYRNYCFES